MKFQKFFMNVYVSGYYHRVGKPDCTDLHAGDLYLSFRHAEEQAEKDKGWVCTAEVMVPIPDDMVICENSADSKPTPISVTRRILEESEND